MSSTRSGPTQPRYHTSDHRSAERSGRTTRFTPTRRVRVRRGREEPDRGGPRGVANLGELHGVLVGGSADGAGDEDEHASLGPRRLAVDGDDLVLAVLEGERAELAGDGGRALELLALEGEH